MSKPRGHKKQTGSIFKGSTGRADVAVPVDRQRFIAKASDALVKAGLVKPTKSPSLLTSRMNQFADVFLGDTGWLTGAMPLEPKLEEGSPPRRFQYQPGYNIQIQPRSTEDITFPQLRSLSEYTLVRIVIERIKEAMKAHEWDITTDDDANGEQFTEDIARVKDFFEKPDRRHTWDEWLGQLLEDLLSIDAPAIYVHRSRIGDVWALEIIDGATVKVLSDERGFEPWADTDSAQEEPPAYQQFLYGVPYVALTRRELIYRPRNRRANHFYGFSPVEQCVVTINMGLRRELHTLAQFTDGNIPPAIATLPADWKPEEIKQWNDYWNAILAGDPQNRARLRWIPGGAGAGNITKFHDDEVFGLFNQFDEWLSRILCYAFGLSPTAFVKMTNRATAGELGDVEAEQGFASVKLFVERLCNEVIDEYLMMPWLKFNWLTDRGALQAKRVERNVKYVAGGIMTPNEVRIEEGFPAHPQGDNLGPVSAGGGGFGAPPSMPPASANARQMASTSVAAPMTANSGLTDTHDEHAEHHTMNGGGAPAGAATPLEPPPTSQPGGEGGRFTDARYQPARAERSAIDPPLTGPAVTQPLPYGSQGKTFKAWLAMREKELEKWERFAVNRIAQGKSPLDFSCEYISEGEQREIHDALANVSSAGMEKQKLPHALSQIFADRKRKTPVVRLNPPRSGDAAHWQSDLAVKLRTLLETEARRLAGEM